MPTRPSPPAPMTATTASDVRQPGGPSVSPSSRPSPAPRPGGRRRVAGERAHSRGAGLPDAPTAEPTSDAVQALPPAAIQPEPDTSAVEPDGETGRRMAPTWLLAVLGALLVVVLAGLAVLIVVDRRAGAVDAARGEAVRRARTAAVTLLSYDYRRLDADFAAGRALTTAPFAQQYARTTSDAVKKVATDTKATVRAEVAAVGVVSATPERVTLVLFVNQTTTSSRLQRPQVDQNRVEMTLVDKGGRWLVSQVKGL